MNCANRFQTLEKPQAPPFIFGSPPKVQSTSKTSSDMLFSTSFLSFYSATRDKNPYVLHEFSFWSPLMAAIAMPSRSLKSWINCRCLEGISEIFPGRNSSLDLRLWLGFATEPPDPQDSRIHHQWDVAGWLNRGCFGEKAPSQDSSDHLDIWTIFPDLNLYLPLFMIVTQWGVEQRYDKRSQDSSDHQNAIEQLFLRDHY